MEGKSYQPTPEEIKKAEDSLENNQIEMSSERGITLNQVEEKFSKHLEKVQKTIEQQKNGERVSDHRIIPTYPTQEEYDQEQDGELHPSYQEGRDKLKELISSEAYEYVIEEFNKSGRRSGGEEVEVQIYYGGKDFYAPSYGATFPDCWVTTQTPRFIYECDGVDYYKTEIVVRKRMTQEDLVALEQYCNSKEYAKEVKDSMYKSLMEDHALNFISSFKKTEKVNAQLDNIFHPNGVSNATKNSRYYDIDFNPYGRYRNSDSKGKLVKIEGGNISEEIREESGIYVSSNSENDIICGVSEVDLSKIDGYLGNRYLLGDYTEKGGVHFTSEQVTTLKERLLELANDLDPGKSNITNSKSGSREDNLRGYVRAGYGKEDDGKTWVEAAYVDYAYQGPLHG